MSEVTQTPRLTDSTSQQAYIAEHYPKKEAKPGPGVFVCKKCGLVNHSKNPWMRNDHIADQWIAQLGSMILLTTIDDPARGAATSEDLRGWKATEEDANFCIIRDYRKNRGGTRQVWNDQLHKIPVPVYNVDGSISKRKVSGEFTYEGGYETVVLEADPFLFHQEGMKTGSDEYNCFREWVTLQMEPEQDLVLRMSLWKDETKEKKAADLFRLIRKTPEDRLEQLTCHLFGSHQWEGESLI